MKGGRDMNADDKVANPGQRVSQKMAKSKGPDKLSALGRSSTGSPLRTLQDELQRAENFVSPDTMKAKHKQQIVNGQFESAMQQANILAQARHNALVGGAAPLAPGAPPGLSGAYYAPGGRMMVPPGQIVPMTMTPQHPSRGNSNGSNVEFKVNSHNVTPLHQRPGGSVASGTGAGAPPPSASLANNYPSLRGMYGNYHPNQLIGPADV